MLGTYAPGLPAPDRVVRLPCGHEDSVPSDASMMAFSVSVLRHIASCPDEGAPSDPRRRPTIVPASEGVIEPQDRSELLRLLGRDLE